MTKDTKAILQELKAVRTLLDVVVKRTALKQTAPKQNAPSRDPDDVDPKRDYLMKLERKDVQPSE